MVPYLPLLAFTGFQHVVIRDRRRFFPTDEMEGLGVLDENWETIRGELDELREVGVSLKGVSEVDPAQSRLAFAGGWKCFLFRFYGVDVPENRELCPKTAALLDQVPNVVSAGFSVLEPGMRLPVHSGPVKGVLRYHLGMIVPQGDCGITVGGQTRGWDEGKSFLIDDIFLHTAWNDADSDRVVLLVDVERPMPWPWLTTLNRRVLGLVGHSRRSRAGARRSAVSA
jgi:beta-hydroxylase